MMRTLDKLVNLNEEWVEHGLHRQIIDPDSRYDGGVIDITNGIPWPNHHAGTPVWMAVWTAALVNPDSVYYHNADILQRLERAAEYMLRVQHEDGSISPGWTNFHSPPDTGFVIVGYAQLYLLLSSQVWSEAERVVERIKLFLERTIPVMLTGGCHTPNHRWVLCAALGYLYRIFGDERLTQRAEQWLAEGLDITPDGEWTERSNGIYNAVSDVMLIHAARELNRPELLQPARHNLEMMIYLIHPSGEVVTDYSGRQDFGQMFTMESYLLSYYLLNKIDRNPRFAAMEQLAADAIQNMFSSANNPLIGMLLYPRAADDEVQPEALPHCYRRMINGTFGREHYVADVPAAGHHNVIRYSRPHLDFGAPVLRMRQERTSLTMMTETSSLLALRHGNVRLLGVQLASYFSPGFVPMQTLTETDTGYVMTAVYYKGYNGPIAAEQLPDSAAGEVSPWYLLPHQFRAPTHTCAYRVEVEMVEQIGGLDLYIRSTEPAEVMTQLSFVFGNESVVVAEDGELEPVHGEAIALWKNGLIRVENGADWIVLSGGAAEHTAVSVREAAYPGDCRTLLVNLVTPFEHKVSIRLSPGAATDGAAQALKWVERQRG
ncbi:hypothetical protein [Paenibacillus campi]|uniref:hypothetical protein n=1 Tax=Paenibacillus campi TaxID=3106031 RepID=UPI002AFE817A|nr:hypothetical protein [Paenibacillus sp. SGZ-1014]